MKYTRITLRIPEPLHDKLSREAEVSSKSMNAEIVGRLQQTFQAEEAGAECNQLRGFGGLESTRYYQKSHENLQAKLDEVLKLLKNKNTI
ncbi:Arc family DNA-binding protein [Oceanisphaera pacifica]|uniref:Arc family DNA-binding protein n=1 Tax=Oceanisphaera pacifica TaxID=2818389 RepID=A0ABS3NIR2_9GAMM|nr:Arc family DNA-binding protein [Oceanisphaera pacifica]